MVMEESWQKEVNDVTRKKNKGKRNQAVSMKFNLVNKVKDVVDTFIQN